MGVIPLTKHHSSDFFWVFVPKGSTGDYDYPLDIIIPGRIFRDKHLSFGDYYSPTEDIPVPCSKNVKKGYGYNLAYLIPKTILFDSAILVSFIKKHEHGYTQVHTITHWTTQGVQLRTEKKVLQLLQIIRQLVPHVSDESTNPIVQFGGGPGFGHQSFH